MNVGFTDKLSPNCKIRRFAVIQQYIASKPQINGGIVVALTWWVNGGSMAALSRWVKGLSMAALSGWINCRRVAALSRWVN